MLSDTSGLLAMGFLPVRACRRQPAIGLALFFPWGVAEAASPLALLLAMPVLVLKLAIGGFALALIETLSAKMRIFRVPEFLATAFLLAVMAMLIRILLGA